MSAAASAGAGYAAVIAAFAAKNLAGKKVLVAMSGGVDSSFVMHALARANVDVAGVYMRLHARKNYHESNIKNAQTVCSEYGANFDVLDLSAEFSERVYEQFFATYAAGRTPNPCALCNRFIKLGALADYAAAQGRILATGHYARLQEHGGRLFIAKAADAGKDQSYFLAAARPNSLENVIFPLGGAIKSELKKEALSLPFLRKISEQKESSEICFVESDYQKLLDERFANHAGNQPGLVRDAAGKIVGEHDGYMKYTIGKRRGFSVHGAHEPHFVLRIDAAANEIVVGKKSELFVGEFELENLNAFGDLAGEISCCVKVRYNSEPAPCVLETASKKVRLAREVFALASAQLAVFYEGERVIASGFIK